MPHIHDLIDFTVAAYIVYTNKVLFVYHKEYERWLPIGGHIELDEDPEQTLFREIQEESNLEVEIMSSKPEFTLDEDVVKPLYCPVFLDIHRANKTHRHIKMVYFAKAKTDKFQMADEEHSDIRWFSYEDLDNPEFHIRADDRFYSKEALRISSW